MNNFISKTGNIDKVTLVNGDKKQNKSAVKGDGTFDRILIRQAKQSAENLQPKASGTLAEIQSPIKIPSVSPSLDAAEYAKRIETSLDLLEAYAATLDTPDKTLKQANDILEKILTHTQSLAVDFEKSPPEDPDLSSILTHLISTVETEKIKFDRGDYTV